MSRFTLSIFGQGLLQYYRTILDTSFVGLSCLISNEVIEETTKIRQTPFKKCSGKIV